MQSHTCRIGAAAAAAGYRLDDPGRWLKPIRFGNNMNTDGLQWKRHINIIFPCPTPHHNLAVQYLARIHPLRPVKDSSPRLYHRAICSERSCQRKTRVFHLMLMRFLCTECVNSKKLTYTLLSFGVAKRFYAVNRFQVKVLPCARFRDKTSPLAHMPEVHRAPGRAAQSYVRGHLGLRRSNPQGSSGRTPRPTRRSRRVEA